MRVLVTGSRTFTDPEPIHHALTEAARTAASLGEPLTVVHGGAHRGADYIAAQWAAARVRDGWQVVIEPHPADWDRLGQRAGMVRNTHMVAAGADLCIAFIRECESSKCTRPRPHGSHGSHGATHCAELAAEAGIRTVVCDWTENAVEVSRA